MKTYLKNIAKLAYMALATITTACSDSNTSDLQLSGNVYVTQFAADNYDGTIDNTSKTITVAVPETYNTTNMEVTKLALSDGAVASMKQGDKLNLSFPQSIKVTNGDVYQTYTISVQHDEAKITAFRLNDTYLGSIDETNKTITVRVPSTLDVTNLVPTVTTSMADAVVSPVPGTGVDFTNPVDFTVTYNTATAVYTVTVVPSDAPEYLYVGWESSYDNLGDEEKTACQWMMNTFGAEYASFTDIQSGKVDISKCKVMWWHLHIDGGIDSKDKFESKAPEAVSCAVKLKDYLANGGALLLTRYATFLPAYLGLTADGSIPNNCWGQVETDAETTGGAWDFSNSGHQDHALYQGLLDNENGHVYTCDANYRITNSTAQWHIGSDWGGYADYDTWRTLTGATDLGYGGDGAIVVWEFPATTSRGGVLCIGSGCYDWYATGMDSSTDKYHVNIETMTKNAINYLKGE